MKQTLYKLDKKVAFIINALTDPFNGEMKHGSLKIDWENLKMTFTEELSMVKKSVCNYIRRIKVYDNGMDLKVMQACDGTYKMTAYFQFDGWNDWRILLRLMQEAYHGIKG